MEAMIIFGWIGLAIIIYLLFGLADLRARVKRLEQSLRGATPSMAQGIMPESPSPSQDPLAPVSAPAPSYTQVLPDTGSDWWSRFTRWAAEDWLLKLGALLLIMGFGWLVTYAFLNNWIGPTGRITLGLVAGALILILGWWRMGRFKEQGAVFIVLGATTILLTIFAARSIYDFFTPLSGMAIMFLASAFVGLASVKYRVRSLAICGIIMASIVPLLVASPVRDDIALFYYLFLVTVGILWIVLITGWRDLLVLSLATISLYSMPHWAFAGFSHPLGLDTLTLLAFGFVAVFFLANIFSFFFARDGATNADIIGAMWTSLFLVFWVFSGVAREWQSLMFAAWTVAFVIAAFFLYTRTGNKKPLITYAGIGIMLLGIATACELDGAALTIAFTLEAAVATFLTHVLFHDRRMSLWASALFALPALLSLQNINRYPHYGAVEGIWNTFGYASPATPIFHEHFFVLLILAVAFLALGFFFKRPSLESGFAGDGQTKLHQLHVVLGSVYAYILLWLVLHEIFPPDMGTMLTLAVYTVVGLVAYLYGRKNDLRAFRIYGGTLLGFVVARLLLIEVWKMELFGKVITFFLVGILLMSTAFVGRKKKDDAPTLMP